MAALKLFQADLKLVAPGGPGSMSTATYALTAASPNYPATGAYLNFWGTCDQIYWDPNPISNNIAFVLGKKQYADVEVHLGNVKPGKTYLVTFNVVAMDPKKVLMLTQTFSGDGNLLGQSSFQPTSVIQGQASIPIVVNPGANGATLNVTPAQGDSSKVIAEFTVESGTVEQL